MDNVVFLVIGILIIISGMIRLPEHTEEPTVDEKVQAILHKISPP